MFYEDADLLSITRLSILRLKPEISPALEMTFRQASCRLSLLATPI